MKPIIIIALVAVVLATVLGVLIFYRPQGIDNKEKDPQEEVNNGISEETVLAKRTGVISDISDSLIIISGNEGQFNLSLSKDTEFSDDGGNASNASFFFKGVSVEAEERGGRAFSVHALSLPKIIISSPSSFDIPVGQLFFNISGKALADSEKIFFALKNRRTSSEYFSNSFVVVDDGTRYGVFSIPVDLSTALDILDGDALDMRFFIKDKDNKETDIFSTALIYHGGLVSRIKIYLGKGKGSCANTYAVERLVSASRSATRAAIEELIKGPTGKEKAEGYFSNIDPTTRIRSLEPRAENTLLDLDNSILRPAGGCSLSFSKMQIEKSLKENPMVKGIIMTVNGESGPLR